MCKSRRHNRPTATSPCVSRAAFTLIELLTAIAIIGVMTALLLPAVQAAREAARRMQCSNHLKQISLAAANHESVHGWYPTGGWSKRWIGLPERGYGNQQPGGWAFNLLPFLEQASLHDFGGPAPTDAADLAGNTQRLETPLPTFYCPSRRGTANYANTRVYLHANPTAAVARNDYAFNGGHRAFTYGNGPDSLAEAATFPWPDTSSLTGISYQRSQVHHATVTDGLSSTYLVAEKHLPILAYTSGTDQGDNECVYSGDDRDLVRYTGGELDITFRPLSDAFVSAQDGLVFGSAHAAGFFAALCDGSVRMINFNLDQRIHSRLGRRNDGQTIGEF